MSLTAVNSGLGGSSTEIVSMPGSMGCYLVLRLSRSDCTTRIQALEAILERAQQHSDLLSQRIKFWGEEVLEDAARHKDDSEEKISKIARSHIQSLQAILINPIDKSPLQEPVLDTLKKVDTVIMDQAYELDEYEENSKDRDTATHRNKLTGKFLLSCVGGGILLSIVGIAIPPAAIWIVLGGGMGGIELYTHIRQVQRKKDLSTDTKKISKPIVIYGDNCTIRANLIYQGGSVISTEVVERIEYRKKL